VEKAAAGQLKAPARVDDYFAAGLFPRDFLDRFDGLRHREERPDFSFADEQRHSSIFLSPDRAILFAEVRGARVANGIDYFAGEFAFLARPLF
jgi:hypothetical protein